MNNVENNNDAIPITSISNLPIPISVNVKAKYLVINVDCVISFVTNYILVVEFGSSFNCHFN